MNRVIELTEDEVELVISGLNWYISEACYRPGDSDEAEALIDKIEKILMEGA